MFDKNWRQQTAKRLLPLLMAVVLVFSLVSCTDRTSTSEKPGSPETGSGQTKSNISEVSPPLVIQQLRQALENYRPQVAILSPQPNEVLQDNSVTVQFQVQDLPIFKNPELGLGPHLHVFLDNQPYQAVYDLNQPLVFSDLAPGTHTLRVFASRPWHESFKNEGAYAQTTFHIFTKTDDNNPDSALPLLTYSRPQASYGAEPIMLDFYLTNAPLHELAQENPDDEIADWRVRCTVNGESFIIDRWQPIYLKGFKPGKNWVQLELLNEQGNPYKNVYNNAARVITYEPNGKDTLSQLVRGELSVADARGIVDPSYVTKAPEPTPLETPTPEAVTTPAVEVPSTTPTPEAPAPVAPDVPAVEETATPTPSQEEIETTKPAQAEPTPPKQVEKPRRGGFFNRFRRPAKVEVKPEPTPTEAVETPTPEPVAPETPAPQPETVPKAEEAPVTVAPDVPAVEETPAPEPVAPETPTPQPETVPKAEEAPVAVPPAVPVVEETPAAEPETAPTPQEAPVAVPPAVPVVEETPAPELPQAEPSVPVVEETTPAEIPTTATEQVEEPTGYFKRLPQPDAVEAKPEVTPSGEVQTPTPEQVIPETSASQPETQPEPKVEENPIPQVKPAETTQTEAKSPETPEKRKYNQYFGKYFRSRQPADGEVKAEPSLPPTLPEIIDGNS